MTVTRDAEVAAPPFLFPTDLPGSEWVEFQAAGFSQPVCGVIYRLAEPPTNGMPLGGIDTGCIDLETSGLWGYCTIFNSHVPRRGPLNLPFLGLSVGGQTWVLCDAAQTKPYVSLVLEDNYPGARPAPPPELKLEGVRTPREIHYWGHYPVVDLEYEIDSPVSVGLRAWAPFLPGDIESSLLPGIVFEVHLRNPGDGEERGTVAFSFPGPLPGEAGGQRFRRQEVQGDFCGVVVKAPRSSHAIGAIDAEHVRLGGELGADGAAWARIAERLPLAAEDRPGASAAVDFVLAPGEEKIVRFVLAWHSPRWKGEGEWDNFHIYSDGYRRLWRHHLSPLWTGHCYMPDPGHVFTHMYAKRYKSALAAAKRLARKHGSLLRRILAWQEVIYSDEALPVWLRDSLINVLHLITEDGMWAQAGPPLPEWVRPEEGLFGMNECPRGCPQIECLPCSFYGNLPLVYFFPKLALSTLRGYKGYQYEDGAPPWVFGGCTVGTPLVDFAMPGRGYQATLNVPCYVDMLDRYLTCYRDGELLREFYPSLKKTILYMVDLNRGPDGIISMPDRRASDGPVEWETEWFEFCEWHGMATHVGGIHLATLQMAQRMAEQMGDREFARQCQEWIGAGQHSMETKMWTGRYYLNFWDPAKGKKSDHVFGYQLDGEWMARFHGLPGVFRSDRVATTLETIRRANVSPTPYGAVNFAKADESMPKPGEEGPWVRFYQPYDFCPAEVLMLGMTYMYDGKEELGVELARRCWHTIVCRQGTTWDLPAAIRGDTGEPAFGNDYYQSMMLWSLPAAMHDGDLTAPLRPGGLVDRIIRASAGKNE